MVGEAGRTQASPPVFDISRTEGEPLPDFDTEATGDAGDLAARLIDAADVPGVRDLRDVLCIGDVLDRLPAAAFEAEGSGLDHPPAQALVFDVGDLR